MWSFSRAFLLGSQITQAAGFVVLHICFLVWQPDDTSRFYGPPHLSSCSAAFKRKQAEVSHNKEAGELTEAVKLRVLELVEVAASQKDIPGSCVLVCLDSILGLAKGSQEKTLNFKVCVRACVRVRVSMRQEGIVFCCVLVCEDECL